MERYLHNGNEFNEHTAIVIGEGDDATQYPAGWFKDPAARTEHDVRVLHDTQPVTPDYHTAVRAGYTMNPDNSFNIDWDYVAWTAAEISAYKTAQAAVAWEAIKASRDLRKSLGVNVNGVWFHSDTESRIQWLGLKDSARDVLAAGGNMLSPLQKLGQNVMWKPMGTDTKVLTTVQLAFDVVAAVGNLDAYLFYVADQHKAASAAAVHPQLYDFSAGWPAHFIG
jgi:hypothetical protein